MSAFNTSKSTTLMIMNGSVPIWLKLSKILITSSETFARKPVCF